MCFKDKYKFLDTSGLDRSFQQIGRLLRMGLDAVNSKTLPGHILPWRNAECWHIYNAVWAASSDKRRGIGVHGKFVLNVF